MGRTRTTTIAEDGWRVEFQCRVRDSRCAKQTRGTYPGWVPTVVTAKGRKGGKGRAKASGGGAATGAGRGPRGLRGAQGACECTGTCKRASTCPCLAAGTACTTACKGHQRPKFGCANMGSCGSGGGGSSDRGGSSGIGDGSSGSGGGSGGGGGGASVHWPRPRHCMFMFFCIMWGVPG